MHAEYDASDDEYCTHRVSQAFDTAQLIDYTACGADLCILGGDLNTQSTDLPYKLLCQVAQLRDCFLATGKVPLGGIRRESVGIALQLDCGGKLGKARSSVVKTH